MLTYDAASARTLGNGEWNFRCWHIASFQCDAEFGRYRGVADIDQAASVRQGAIHIGTAAAEAAQGIHQGRVPAPSSGGGDPQHGKASPALAELRSLTNGLPLPDQCLHSSEADVRPPSRKSGLGHFAARLSSRRDRMELAMRETSCARAARRMYPTPGRDGRLIPNEKRRCYQRRFATPQGMTRMCSTAARDR